MVDSRAEREGRNEVAFGDFLEQAQIRLVGETREQPDDAASIPGVARDQLGGLSRERPQS